MRRSILLLVLIFLTFGGFAAQRTSGQGQSWLPGDFLIADTSGGRIAVYNVGLTFKGYLDITISDVWGLTLLSNGNLAAVSRSGGPLGGRIRIYNPSGAIVQTIDDANVGNPIDLKVSSIGDLYSPRDSSTASAAIARYNSGGFVATFGTNSFSGLAVLPGNILWAGGNNPAGGIDPTVYTFSLTTHTLTGSFPLDNGQVRADAMFYSLATNTVLMIGGPGFNTVYERGITGTHIRTFTAPIGDFVNFGVTRGPGGDVFATRAFGSQVVHRWTGSGTFVSTTSIAANVSQPANIVWVPTGTTAASVTVSGRVADTAGYGLRNATVSISGPSGIARTTRSNPFGYFRFDGIEAGNTYIVSVKHKAYQFTPRTVLVDDNVTDLEITPDSPGAEQKKGRL